MAETAWIVDCCCHSFGGSEYVGTVPPALTLPPLDDQPVIVPHEGATVCQRASWLRIPASPPRLALLDLPTLFGTLLI